MDGFPRIVDPALPDVRTDGQQPIQRMNMRGIVRNMLGVVTAWPRARPDVLMMKPVEETPAARRLLVACC